MNELQQERDKTLEEFTDEAIRSALIDLHTALPARITSFSASAQTATVAIETQRQIRQQDGTLVAESISPIENVPVLFPRAGGFSITFPVEPGDKCLLVFVERDLSGWLKDGLERVPPTARRHAYSDAVAILGLAPASDPISPGADGSALQIRSDDGATVIEVGASDITITSAGAVSIDPTGAFSVNSTGAITLTRGAVELLTVLSAALDAIATSTVGGVPLSEAATIAAQKLLVDAMRS